jgi:hypothetical protein
LSSCADRESQSFSVKLAKPICSIPTLDLGRVAELADVAVGVDDVVRAEPVRLAGLHPEVHDAFDLGDAGGVVAFRVVQDDADGRHGAVRERARGGVERDRRFMDRR